jgi:hypothetical protein
MALIFFTIVGTLLARFLGVIIVLGFMGLFQKTRNQLAWNERFLIAAGGSVRGAIAFGLAL